MRCGSSSLIPQNITASKSTTTERQQMLMFGRTEKLKQQHLQLLHNSNRRNTKIRHTMLRLQ